MFCPVRPTLLEQLLIIVLQMKMKCTPISIFSSLQSFQQNLFSHVPIIIFCFKKKLRTSVRCRHVVKRSPEKAAGFSTKPTTISSLINLRQKAHMMSAVTAALTAVLGVFLGKARTPLWRSESPIAATLVRGAKSYMPRTFA